ncbi:sodium:solute symporter [Candidatus Sumerlaeota bacterium]|nr:sodium:solute symporter [Candidatus Sumerlaeota bacterium]
MNGSSLQTSAVDLAIVLFYIALIVGVGAYSFRKSRSVEGFSLGGRSLPGWALGLSIVGTLLSSNTFIGVPGKAYSANWSSFVFSLTIPIVCLVAARYFIPLYRNRRQTTAYEHLEIKFGPLARAYSALSLILLQIGRFAVVLYLVSLAMGPLLSVNVAPGQENRMIATIILVLGGLTILYTVIGGFSAVVWTDVIQTIVLAVGAVVCSLILLAKMPEGLGGFLETAMSHEKFSFGGWDFDLMLEGFWVVFIYGIIENVKNFGVDQNYIQRFLSAKSDREARKSLWIGGLLYVPLSALFFFIGTALYVYYLDAAPTDLPAEPDRVFPHFIATELPTGVRGLLIAAILAAGMSTLDSSANVSATVWAVDFYRRFIRPDCDDRRMLKVTRISTVAIGIIGTAASLLMINTRSALDVWWQISAVFGGGMLGLFLLGILIPKATPRGAAWGIIAGILAIIWGTLCQDLPGRWAALNFPFHKFLIGFVGTFAILFVGWIESFIARPEARGEG